MSLFVLALTLLLTLGAAPAAAEYPERPLTIVAAYPAGGMVDIVARPIAESMKKKFPKGVAVLNRPGGGGSVGLAEVVQAKPDGYTIILAPVSTLVIHPQINDLPYKTPDDYEPIMNTIAFNSMLVVRDECAVEDRPGVRRRRQGQPGQAARRLAGRGHLESPQPRAADAPRQHEGHARAVLRLGRVEPRDPGRSHRRGRGAARRDQAARRCQETAPAGGIPGEAPARCSRTRRRRRSWARPTALGTWFVLTAPKGTPRPS